MPKFKKKITEIDNHRDEWFFILNNLSALQEIPLSLKSDPIFKKLFMEAEISNYSEEQAEAYYASMKERWEDLPLKKQPGMKESARENLRIHWQLHFK